jgi:predicted ATPase
MPAPPTDEVGRRPPCECRELAHPPRRVVLTGGPGAGKTAVLEVVRRQFCQHVVVLPEAASMLFGGGFPRASDDAARRAAQRAIFHVQDQLERLELERARAAVIVCDRGTIDGVAYWPGPVEQFWAEVGTTRDDQLDRYAAVIHLRTPPAATYNHDNPLRIESAAEAAHIDERILAAWGGHPMRVQIQSEAAFLDKLDRALAAVRDHVPACCRPRL